MTDKALPSREKSPGQEGHRLESWKEIAVYLGRDVRTVQRWERGEGLPVHRLHHSKLGSVYAYASELDAWRIGREPGAAAEANVQALPPSTLARIEIEEALSASTPSAPPEPGVAAVVQPAPRWRRALVWGLSGIVLAALAAGTVWYRRPRASKPVIRLTMGIAPADQLTGFR